MAIAIRFFSALVSLRAASIFRLTSLCSLSASRRFSASVPMPSSLDTCSSLCKLVIESVPISTWAEEKNTVKRVRRFLVLELLMQHFYRPGLSLRYAKAFGTYHMMRSSSSGALIICTYYLCGGMLGSQTTQQSENER